MIKINRPSCPNPAALRTNYRHSDNKSALRQASYDKCMYCESPVSQVYYGDVEHIKPKSKYPNLEFEWANLGYVCAKCNGLKKDNFDETCPFVNPYDENPADFIVPLGEILHQRQGNERGELTIAVLDLNREELIERRREALGRIKTLVDKIARSRNAALKELALKEVHREVTEDKQYSMVVSACLDRLLA